MSDQQSQDVLQDRMAGVLLHPTSLPGGNLGSDAYRFVDFLDRCGIRCWQTLPLGQPSHGLSPYQCLSAHAGNIHLIDRDELVNSGWFRSEPAPDDDTGMKIITQAWKGFQCYTTDEEMNAFIDFSTKHGHWLDDYALFLALRAHHDNLPWWEWPSVLRNREATALLLAHQQLKDEVDVNRFAQFLFFRQWHALRDYANSKGILIFGDTPIFVAENSADVWAERHLFLLDENGRPDVVAGVPPDYFSETGQRWGNPLYDWEKMEEEGFRWWLNRIGSQLELFDLLRIDHFRGFESYWSIPASCETAIDGHWEKAPGHALFNTLGDTFPTMPIVVEDLGIITQEVTELRDHFNLPGTKVLQFAFDGMEDNPYLPENLVENSVVYTGTHDNDTTLGWYQALSEEERTRISCSRESGSKMPWPIIECALNSISKLAIIPLQDLLELDSQSRMNIPGVVNDNNWAWQFEWSEVNPALPGKVRSMIDASGRSPL